MAYWKNCCEHTNYVGSFTTIEKHGKNYREMKYDLYVYNDNHRQGICLRFGNEPEMYLGTYLEFVIKDSIYEPHASAWKLLQEKGRIYYQGIPVTPII